MSDDAFVFLRGTDGCFGPLPVKGPYSPFLCFHGERGLLAWNGYLYRKSRERLRTREMEEFEIGKMMRRLL